VVGGDLDRTAAFSRFTPACEEIYGHPCPAQLSEGKRRKRAQTLWSGSKRIYIAPNHLATLRPRVAFERKVDTPKPTLVRRFTSVQTQAVSPTKRSLPSLPAISAIS